MDGVGEAEARKHMNHFYGFTFVDSPSDTQIVDKSMRSHSTKSAALT